MTGNVQLYLTSPPVARTRGHGWMEVRLLLEGRLVKRIAPLKIPYELTIAHRKIEGCGNRMAKKTGGGAALFAGADFQARLGAYALASALTETKCTLVRGSLESVSFETGESVDDLLLRTRSESSYIQAKRSLNYSLNSTSPLFSTLNQFAKQEAAQSDRLILATTSRSSKKITQDLRTALDLSLIHI